jgi:hypothetical protein
VATLPTGRNVPKNSNLTDACTHHLLLSHIGQHTTSTMDYNLQTQQDNMGHNIGSVLKEYRWTNSQATLCISLQICPLFSSGTTRTKNLFLSSLPPLISGKSGREERQECVRGREEWITPITSRMYTSLWSTYLIGRNCTNQFSAREYDCHAEKQ